MTSEADELPPMPSPAYGWSCDYYVGWSYTENPQDRWQEVLLFTEEQMQTYARAAIQQERERCAKACDDKKDGTGDLLDSACIKCAEAIRRDGEQP